MPVIDSTWVYATNAQLSELSISIDSLQGEFDALQNKSDLLYSIIGTSNDSISNQLTAAGILLALVAIIIAIVGVYLHFSLAKKKNDIEKLATTIDEKKRTIDEIAKTTRELDKQIHSNLKGLYSDLREEETKALLDRLVLEPGDISNLIELLFVRELNSASYAKVREAFMKLKTEGRQSEEDLPMDTEQTSVDAYDVNFEEKFFLLFYQHFCYQAIKDDYIRPLLVQHFDLNCQCAFKRDIINSTIDICKALSEEESTFNKVEVLSAYLKAIDHSRFKSLKELKNIFEQNLIPSTLLGNAIEQCEKDGVYLKLFGREKTIESSVEPEK